MVSFVQQVEGVRDTGIGNQQIVQGDLSWTNTLARGVSNVIEGVDEFGTRLGEQKATDLVSKAQKQVDLEVKEAEELAKINALGDDAGAQDVARKAALLEKGVAQGRISRENARLRVADLVTKGIEESPFFADKIRRSASRLLGFDPQSEAVQQFFGAFEPAGARETVSATEKRAQFLSQNTGMSLASSRQLIAQQDMLDLQKKIRQDRLAIGDMTIDEALAQKSSEDDIEGINAIFGEAIALVNSGQNIDAQTWAQLATKYENAFVLATLDEFASSGIPMTSAQQSKVRETTKARYNRIGEQLQQFDQTLINKQNLDRLVTSQKLFGAQAMPVFSTLVNAFGERIGGQLIDLYANAAGKPERLEAALGANPALRPFINLLSQDPKGFTTRMNNSLLKLNDPAATIEAEDAAFIDVFLNNVVKTAKPEERESVITQLQNKNLNTKAASVLALAGRTGATPTEVKYMKENWDLVRGTTPSTIINKIREGNRTLTDRNARIEIAPDGKSLVLYQGVDLSTGQPRQATGHPAWSDVQKINTYINAASRGWGRDLGINDVQKLAKELQAEINSPFETQGADVQATIKKLSPERLEELRAEAKRRLEQR